MTYYKFLRLKDDQVISDWDESAWEKNEWRDIADNPVLQAQGFYASEPITNAVQWFGNVLAEVRGPSVPGRVMSVHQGMRIVRAWKFSRQDWLDLAIYTAELVLPIFESRFPDDRRPRAAIESGSAAGAAGAAGSAADAGARSAAHAARAAVAAQLPSRARQMLPPTPRRPLNQRTAPHTVSPLPRALMFRTSQS